MRQAAQEERRQITVAARTGRTVDFLGDADGAGVVEHAIEADDRFGARQRRTGAGMAAAAEGDMQARVVALDLELAGGFEPARIAVGGAVGDVQEGAGGDVDAADLRRLLRQAEVAQSGRASCWERGCQYV